MHILRKLTKWVVTLTESFLVILKMLGIPSDASVSLSQEIYLDPSGFGVATSGDYIVVSILDWSVVVIGVVVSEEYNHSNDNLHCSSVTFSLEFLSKFFQFGGSVEDWR